MADDKKAPEHKAPVSAVSVAPEGTAQANDERRARQAGQHGSFGGNRDRRGGRGFRRDQDPYQEEVVDINKVTKVVKGGKHMRFAALVVIGDGKGKFGFGQGKSAEVPVAIKKAIEYAHGALVTVPFAKGNTIPHEVRGKCGVCEVYLKPAPAGTGIIAGGAVRSIMQLSGVKNIYSKVYGRRTPINVVRATIDALGKLRTKEYVEKNRLGLEPVAKPVAAPVKEATK